MSRSAFLHLRAMFRALNELRPGFDPYKLAHEPDPPDDVTEVLLPLGNAHHDVFMGLGTLGQLASKSDGTLQIIAAHLEPRLPRQASSPSQDEWIDGLAAMYECFVFASLRCSGIECEFTDDLGKPDIIASQLECAIECTDSHSSQAISRDEAKVVEHVQRKILVKEAQIASYCDANGLAPVIALDVPEEMLELLRDRAEAERKRIVMACRGINQSIEKDGTARQAVVVARPGHVLLSSFNIHTYGAPDEDSGALQGWFSDDIQSGDTDARVFDLKKALFGSMRKVERLYGQGDCEERGDGEECV